VHCQCEKKTIEERFKKATEAEEIGDDAKEELEASNKQAEKFNDEIKSAYAARKDQVRLISLNTDGSQESILESLAGYFQAKIILVNTSHRERPPFTQVMNLAVKYNMLQVSAHDVIQMNIMNETAAGKELLATRKAKKLVGEERKGHRFHPQHYDQSKVFSVLQQHIAEKRTNQQFILMQAFGQTDQLKEEDDKLALRFMDELF